MDFSKTPEQINLQERIIQFAQTELTDDLIGRDQNSEFSEQNWQKCADFGIVGLAVPTEYGGSGADHLTVSLAMEAFGYGCRDNGLALAINAQRTVQYPIIAYGTPEQKEKYLPGLANGSIIGVQAITEAQAGSDIYSMKARAEKVEDGYLINAAKKFITLGPKADLALVFATLDPEMGKWGITPFLVEINTSGISISPNREKMGLRTAPIGEINFDNCFIPSDNLFGQEGSGVGISRSTFEYERFTIIPNHIGAMQYQLEQALAYAKQREQFGKPITQFQSISNRLANMKLRLETARLLLYKAAWLKDQNQDVMMEACLVNLYLAESFVESSMDSIRIHGGNGYMTDFEVERDLRDAVGTTIYAGTSDIQRNIIAKLLEL
jgi:alkylation response protein AidB-like acyl-CoA dehydrogenase